LDHAVCPTLSKLLYRYTNWIYLRAYVYVMVNNICGAEKETIQHIVEECPLTKFQQGFSKLYLLTEDALNWLQQIKNI
jgi:hypothetical protein